MLRGGRLLERFVSWRPQSHIEPGTVLQVNPPQSPGTRGREPRSRHDDSRRGDDGTTRSPPRL